MACWESSKYLRLSVFKSHKTPQPVAFGGTDISVIWQWGAHASWSWAPCLGKLRCLGRSEKMRFCQMQTHAIHSVGISRLPIPLKRSQKSSPAQPPREEPVSNDACKSYTAPGLTGGRLEASLQIPRAQGIAKNARERGQGDDSGQGAREPTFWVCVGTWEPHQAHSRPPNFCQAREREPCCCFFLVTLNKSRTGSSGHSTCTGPSSASRETQVRLFFSP